MGRVDAIVSMGVSDGGVFFCERCSIDVLFFGVNGT